jgi:chromosome segregation ATPase
MTHLPTKPGTSKHNAPLTKEQFETINTMLRRLVDLIMPLHKLLESYGGLEDEVADRIEQVIEALAAISTSLRTSATALSDMKTSQADFRRMEKHLAALGAHQRDLTTRLEGMETKLDMLIDWLGARPPRQAAAPIS